MAIFFLRVGGAIWMYLVAVNEAGKTPLFALNPSERRTLAVPLLPHPCVTSISRPSALKLVYSNSNPMSTPPVSAPPSLSHLQWRATEWLLAFGPLRPEIVMDYFVLSPFFDRTSNNATLRMQMQFSRGGMEGVDEEGELRCVSAFLERFERGAELM
jgi:hypothetical protein